ncbi:Transcription factor fungi [Macrophomina phaseolina MS6]|uniref:Transcription factor fungi n=1 Tax=Macrophomina phaseolina (strain MS6) TaxID=1126212 RepID=K2S5A2_MACPH|nr:Transcription factor fungi [Macrophomina phaseolina MS6]
MLEYYEARTTAWEGLHVSRNTRHQGAYYYGPFSLRFFTNQVESCLANLTHQHTPLDSEPNSDAGSIAIPIGGLACLSLEDHINCDYLMKMQQDYLLDSFWSRQHLLFPIIDQMEFRRHYDSLWAESSMRVAFRKPSPIVDIVLALCIQFGAALMPCNDTDQSNLMDVEDTRLAGRVYFQRCHAILNEEANTVSVEAVQCYIYSALYLFNAGRVNSAQALLATAIQAAHTLGLNHEPPDHLPESQRELHRRLWWTLYILDSASSISLGRPCLTQLASASCRLPNDSLEIARALGPNYVSPTKDITWLTFHSQNLLLVNTVRTIHEAYLEKSSDIFCQSRNRKFSKDGQAMEKCARFLADCTKKLAGWAQQVPDGLKLRRREGGDGFSTDRSPLNLDFSVPLWLQRQRLILALIYHKYTMDTYRPFICFSSASSSSFTPLSDNNAMTCLNHAIAITNIIFQTFVEADTLNGLHCVFRYQQEALFTAVGYACAYPVSSQTEAARKAIATAVAVFEHFRPGFSPAKAAANLARELGTKVDCIIENFKSGFNHSNPSRKPSLAPTPSTSSTASDQQSLVSSIPTIDAGSKPSSHIGSPPLGASAHVTSSGIEMAFGPVTSGATTFGETMSWPVTMQPINSSVEQMWGTTVTADNFMREFDFSTADAHGHVHHHVFR